MDNSALERGPVSQDRSMQRSHVAALLLYIDRALLSPKVRIGSQEYAAWTGPYASTRSVRTRSNAYEKSSSRHSAGGHLLRENITAMVVAVICVFIVCELPDVALRLAVTVAQLMVRRFLSPPRDSSTAQ